MKIHPNFQIEFQENPSEILPGRVPGSLKSVPGPFRNTPEPRKRKKSILQPHIQTSTILQRVVLASFWDPAGRQKSTKNGPGAEQVRPEMAPEAIFVVFSRRRRSESLSGPNFGGSDPHSVWPGPHGSHFSVFAKITEKVASGDQFWDQKWLKIDAGATQNRQKS